MKDRKWVFDSPKDRGTLLYIMLYCLFSVIDFLDPILVTLYTLHNGKEVQVHVQYSGLHH